MIIMILNSIMFLLTLLISKTKNPVKMSMMLTIFSFFLFIEMFYLSGSSWFPTLFFLIFMGGILMMFMILSSILPNEKNNKSNKYIFILPLIFFMICFNLKSQVLSMSSLNVKCLLDSSDTMLMLIVLMLLYFFISILMVSKEESPMRKSLC